MNKDKINSKIEDLEAELEKLKKLANEPEQRKPEAGDVYLAHSDVEVVYSGMLPSGYTGLYVDGYPSALSPEQLNKCTYLGKFNEVYVKISDVREALSFEDEDGESVLSNRVSYNSYGLNSSREALRKLNIITD